MNTIKNIFLEASKKLDGILSTRDKTNQNNTLYLHWTWHPRGITNSKLRLIYNNTLKEHSGFNNVIIAYSRAKNLRDSLMKTSLSEPEGKNISDLLIGIRRGI